MMNCQFDPMAMSCPSEPARVPLAAKCNPQLSKDLGFHGFESCEIDSEECRRENPQFDGPRFPRPDDDFPTSCGRVLKLRRLASILVVILFLTAAYVFAWPSANVPYFGAVILHLLAGVLLLVALGYTLRGILRTASPGARV